MVARVRGARVGIAFIFHRKLDEFNALWGSLLVELVQKIFLNVRVRIIMRRGGFLENENLSRQRSQQLKRLRGWWLSDTWLGEEN